MKASPAFVRNVVLACLVLGSACSKSDSTTGPSGGGGGNNGCTQSALKILFNPMYSAFDGVHTFQLPAIVSGIDSSGTKIAWSAADPSMVAMEPDPATGGVMMTMQKAGTTTIYAKAGNLCGAAPLTITAATPDQWMAGSKRYNDGVVIMVGAGAGQATDGGAAANQAACTNCHGETASGPFQDVAHTPTQTGGFSDDELLNIVQHGMVPAGGYFDDSIVPKALWQLFHQWDVGDGKGVVTYLRSLTPAVQKGAFNIGALLDGGIPEGGFQRPEVGSSEGGSPEPDGGVQGDASGS